jgi:uncharacterized protein
MELKSILIAACFAAGCSPLAPRPDHSKLFVLTAVPNAPSPVTIASSSRPLSIGLGPIDFPDYLKRPQMITRTSAYELDLSPVDRWGEPLDENFRRVLSEDLGQMLGTQNIEEYPWATKTDINYQIVISVQRFETDANARSQLTARWRIKDGATGKELYASQTTASSPAGEDAAGSAPALSQDVATLSRDIAAQINRLSENLEPSSAKAPI